MCLSTDYANSNKTFVSTVGALPTGSRYRTPDGNEYMVTDGFGHEDSPVVVDLATGRTMTVDPSTNLGHDRKGRLYASRYLNPARSL